MQKTVINKITTTYSAVQTLCIVNPSCQVQLFRVELYLVVGVTDKRGRRRMVNNMLPTVMAEEG